MIVRIDAENAQLLAHVADVFDAPIDPARVARMVAEPATLLFVAIEEGVVIGQALGHVHRHPDKATELYVDDLAVDEAFRRRGIATALIAALREAGAALGCEELWVATEPDNDGARALYASLGLSERAASVFEDAPG